MRRVEAAKTNIGLSRTRCSSFHSGIKLCLFTLKRNKIVFIVFVLYTDSSKSLSQLQFLVL